MPHAILTSSPTTADLSPASISLSKKRRQDLGLSVYSRIEQALGDRAQLDLNLDYWNSLYEMQVGQKDWPWPNSANVFIPLIPTQLDTLAARLTATVFPPRLFLVNGNTDEAAKYQHEVERYYNAELTRHNWTEKFYQWMHLALRDGTSIMKVVWKKSSRRRKIVRPAPVMSEEGVPVPDPKRPGEPLMTTTVEEIDETTFDDVDLVPVELKNFLILPAYQLGIEEASGVAHKLYLDENQLLAMTRGEEPSLWREAVDFILESVDAGSDQIVEDRQGVETLTLGGQISVSGTDGSAIGDVQQKRGPFIVWEVYTDAYSMVPGDDPEELVMWVDAQTQTLLGCDVYKYWVGKRPFIDLSPMPRLNRFVGFSVVERLRYLQEETNSIHNQRLDNIDRSLGAPMYETDGAKIKDQNMRWAPNAMWQVQQKDDVGFLQAPPVPIEAQSEEQLLQTYAQGLTGLNAPATGQQSTGRRTAKEVSQAGASASVRLDLMAARIRQAMKEIFYLAHHLKLQFGPDDMQTSVATQGGNPEKLNLPKFKLAQDFDLSIQGMGGPVDKQGRQQAMLFLYSLLMKNPLIVQDPMKIYSVTRMLLEEWDRVDIPSLLGTQEQLMQQVQAQQAQAQQQAQMAAATGQPPPGQPQNGKPQGGAQGGGEPPQPQNPMPTPGGAMAGGPKIG